MSERTRILVAWVTLSIVWGATYPAIRVALPTIPPFLLAGARNFTGGLILLALAWRRRAEFPRKLSTYAVIALVGSLLLAGANGGVTWAEQEVSGGLTALVCTSTPLMIALLSLRGARADRLNRRGWSGLVIGFLGLSILLQPWTGAKASSLHLTVLVCAIFIWSLGATIARRHIVNCDPLVATSVEMLSGGGLLLIAAFASGNQLNRPLTPAPVAAMAFLIIFGSCIGFTSFSYLITKLPPSLVSTYSYVNPIVAVLIGALFLAEPFTLTMAVGAAITMAGVFLTNTGRSTMDIQPEPT